MAVQLKPEYELVIGGTSLAIVYTIFGQTAPNMADVRHDEPGNVNTHKSVKMAAITATGAVGALALLSRSPTVFIIGGLGILFETWKYHFANYAANGNEENNSPQVAG